MFHGFAFLYDFFVSNQKSSFRVQSLEGRPTRSAVEEHYFFLAFIVIVTRCVLQGTLCFRWLGLW